MVQIKESTPLDAFLEMRIRHRSGERGFEIIAITQSFIQTLSGMLKRQRCVYQLRGKIIYVNYRS